MNRRENAEVAYFDAKHDSTPRPVLSDVAPEETQPSRSMFDRIGSQSLVLVALVCVAGAAMLANRRQTELPTPPSDQPQSRPLVGSDWPENHSASPATVVADDAQPASSTARARGTDDGSYDPTHEAYGSPQHDRPKDAVPVSRRTSSSDSMQIGGFQDEPSLEDSLFPEGPSGRTEAATVEDQEQSPEPQPTEASYAPNNGAMVHSPPFKPSGSFERVGPDEIPVEPVVVTPVASESSQRSDGTIAGEARSKTPSDARLSSLDAPAVSDVRLNDGPAGIDEGIAALPGSTDPKTSDSLGTGEVQFNAPGNPQAAMISLRSPTPVPHLRFTDAPDAIDWSAYLPKPGTEPTPADPPSRSDPGRTPDQRRVPAQTSSPGPITFTP